MTSRYADIFARSIGDREAFWSEAAEDVHWYKTWDSVLDANNAPFYRWFAGAEVNTCYNAIDVHVENGRGDQAALIYDSPVTDTIRSFTYSELQDKVAQTLGFTPVGHMLRIEARCEQLRKTGKCDRKEIKII